MKDMETCRLTEEMALDRAERKSRIHVAGPKLLGKGFGGGY